MSVAKLLESTQRLLQIPENDARKLLAIVRIQANALEQIKSGLTPCIKCEKVHIPHNSRKGFVPQWDNEGHPYRKETLGNVADKAILQADQTARGRE